MIPIRKPGKTSLKAGLPGFLILSHKSKDKMEIQFTKMHGSGNDFILVDEWAKTIVPQADKERFVKTACDRHFGIGADGVIFLQKSKTQDLSFVFYNPDGSRAEMCGNGIRCLAKYAYEHGLVKRKRMTVETLAGIKTPEVETEDGLVTEVRVGMGRPQILRGEAQVAGRPDEPFIDENVRIGGFEYRITSVGMGNPHAIVYVDSVDQVNVDETGRRIRNHVFLFPKGTNVHFLQKVGDNEFRIRTYERGVEAETLACGTGICASAVASVLNGKADMGRPVLFHARGGDLRVELEGEQDDIQEVYLIGPVQEVFTGKITYPVG